MNTMAEQNDSSPVKQSQSDKNISSLAPGEFIKMVEKERKRLKIGKYADGN